MANPFLLSSVVARLKNPKRIHKSIQCDEESCKRSSFQGKLYQCKDCGKDVCQICKRDGKHPENHELEHIKNTDNELNTAVKHGKADKAEQIILAKGENCGWEQLDYYHKSTPLMGAVIEQQERVIDLLLGLKKENGDFILSAQYLSSKDKNGSSALTLAIDYQISDLVTKLLSRGANPNDDVYEDDIVNNRTLLMEALATNQKSVATELLNHKTFSGNFALSLENLNRKDSKGNRVLDYSLPVHFHFTKSDTDKIAKLLIERGVDFAYQMPNGATPLLIACQTHLASLALTLLDKKDKQGNFILDLDHLNHKDNIGDHALIAAIASFTEMKEIKEKEEMKQVIEKLIARKVSLKNHGCQGFTPLIYTAMSNMPEITEQLLNAKDENDNTVLDLNHINNEQDTKMEENALNWAICQNNSKVIQLLLSRGASLFHDKERKKVMPIKKESFEKFLDSKVTRKPYIEETDPSRGDDGFGKFHDSLILDFDIFNYDLEGTKLLRKIVELTPDHKSIVKHPLIQAYLMMRWKNIKLFWRFLIVLKVIFFGLILTVAYFLYNGTSPRSEELCYTDDSIVNASLVENYTEAKGGAQRLCGSDKIIVTLFSVLLFLVWLLFVLAEAFQIITAPKAWRKDYKNYLQLLILGISGYVIGSVFVLFLHFQDYTSLDTCKHFFGLLFPMVYFEFLFEVGLHPRFKMYISIFTGVFKSFMRYLAVYGLFLVTFAIGFGLMLPLEDKGSNADWPQEGWLILPKIIVMFTGEMEFMDIPFHEENRGLWFLELLFFLGFWVLMILVLLNLLNALAVKNADELLADAEMDKLCDLLHTIEYYDQVFTKNTFADRKIFKKWGKDKSIDIFEENLGNKESYRSKILRKKISVLKNKNCETIYKFHFLVFSEEEKYYQGYSDVPWDPKILRKNMDFITEFEINHSIAKLCKEILLKKSKVKKEKKLKKGTKEHTDKMNKLEKEMTDKMNKFGKEMNDIKVILREQFGKEMNDIKEMFGEILQNVTQQSSSLSGGEYKVC